MINLFFDPSTFNRISTCHSVNGVQSALVLPSFYTLSSGSCVKVSTFILSSIQVLCTCFYVEVAVFTALPFYACYKSKSRILTV